MIKGRAQQTLTKVFDGSGIFSIVLTNENTSVPVSDKGLALNYSATPTDVYVYSGTNLLSPVASNPEAGEFTLTAYGENIIAGRTTINGNVVTIGNASGMVDNKDSYSITVTASGKDFLGNPFSSQKKQVIVPLKHGDDATSYWITSTSSVITKDVKGAMNPAQFTVSALSQSGFNDPSAYKGIFKIYTKTGVSFSDTPDYVSSSPEASHTVALSNTTNDIKVELYDNKGSILIDSQTVPVITQANGVISTKIQYTVTDTEDKPTDSASWSDNFPNVGKGQYLWSKTTFYYTDGSTAVSYSMGRTGADGASAPLLFLSSDNQAFTFSGDGKTPNPTNQLITFVANLQNIQGTATFVATPYLNGAAGTPIGLGGSGNSRTLSIQQFGSTYDSVVVKASLGSLSDTETVYKLKDGSNGIQGPAGADGKSTYIHLAYANSSDGKQDFSISNGVNKTYIGTYTDQNSSGSTDYTKYMWSLIKGSDGVPGPAGVDGKPTYVHFAYANSSDGKQEFSTTVSQGKSYIGVYSDNVSANSTDYTKYTWSLVKGSDGVDAVSGWLTNESITLAADSNGNVPSYTGASGSFVVYYGVNPITNLVISASNTVGMTINTTGMNYSVTSMTTDIAYTDLSVSYQGTKITKRLTLSKSKAGMTGADGTSVVNSTTPPKNPTQGQWWNDLSVTPNILKVYQQGNWVPYRIDAINLVAKSVTTDRLASDVLMASNVTFTNKNGTTTNLQTFDFDGIKTLLTDSNGTTYSSIESAVGSTQTVKGISGDIAQLKLDSKQFSVDIKGAQDSANTANNAVNWQTVNVDDLNNMTNQGKFFIQGGNHTNAPVGGWFYLTVDKPINERITQVAWADSNPTMQYTRILFGSNWSNWNRVVTNETVLSIFNDSWSLGTSANDGITKQLITGINGQADGTLVLSGKSIVLNSQTVKGNDFIIESANIANGAITSAKIASLDARKITTGQLSGPSLNIDLDQGNVFFQKGRIYDSKTQIDVNIDQAYIRTTNGGGSATLQNGRLLLTGPVYNNGQTIDSNPYFSVSASLLPTFSNQPDGAVGSLLQSKDFSEISVNGHGNIGFLANMAAEKGAGVGISAVTGTYIAGNDQGVILSGGKDIGGMTFSESPNFVVGYDDSKGVDGKDAGGNSILARANKFVVAANNYSVDKYGNMSVPKLQNSANITFESTNQSVVFRTGNDYRLQIRENGYIYLWNKKYGSGGSSLQVAGDGALFVQSSATKYKEDIQYDGGTSVGDKFLTLDPATWQDKDEYEQRKTYREKGIEPDHNIHLTDKRYYGLIAEDLVKAGLEEFVVRDEVTGEVNGLEYDKVAISLIPVVREQRVAINELKVEIERLKEKVK